MKGWRDHLERMRTPEWRRWFNRVLEMEGISGKPERKVFNPKDQEYSRPAEIKVAAYLVARRWLVQDVAHLKKGYDLLAERDGDLRKAEVIRRHHWPEGHPTWPHWIYPPRIEARHLFKRDPATHYYICNDPLTRLLLFERDVILAEGVPKKVNTRVTARELMYHISDHLGDYDDLD